MKLASDRGKPMSKNSSSGSGVVGDTESSEPGQSKWGDKRI